MDCVTCHTGVESRERAGFPAIQKCATCHAEFPAAATFPIRRVYRVPDYVFFSHARHRSAKIECSACHGPVAERDVLKKEVPTTMKACVDCHKQAHASVSCTLCHELNQ